MSSKESCSRATTYWDHTGFGDRFCSAYQRFVSWAQSENHGHIAPDGVMVLAVAVYLHPQACSSALPRASPTLCSEHRAVCQLCSSIRNVGVEPGFRDEGGAIKCIFFAFGVDSILNKMTTFAKGIFGEISRGNFNQQGIVAICC